MGYYSEGSILCGRNVAKKIVALPTLFGAKIKRRANGQYRFYWKSVKWTEYEDDEVRAIMQIVNEFLDKPVSENYKDDFVSIIRIGDDDDDTYLNCNYDELNSQWFKRSIEVANDEEAENDGFPEFCTHYYTKLMFEEGKW